MILDVPAVMLAGLAISSFFIPGTETAPCPLATVAMNITSSADVNHLADLLDCAGKGVFNVTWYNSLNIYQRIEISDHKNLTVTGIGFPTIRSALIDDEDIDIAIDMGSSTTGLFRVQNASSLILNQLRIEGGSSDHGGAVSAVSSSLLYVHHCEFTNNNATNGGAISAANSAEVYVDGMTSFRNNSAYLGGAIFSSKSTIYIGGNTSFDSNKAGIGGGIHADESVITMNGITSFRHNSAQGAVETTNVPTSSGGFYSYTEPASCGGAVYSVSSEVRIDGDTIFADSSGSDYGGAMCAEGSWIFMDGGTKFSNNNVD